jgi:hypothetical protein
MTKDIKERFGTYISEGGDPIELALPAVDKLYQNIAALTMLDLYTQGYCAIVVREFFHQLSCCNVTTFYILDNALRQDRFEAVMMLFDVSGVKAVSPQTHGMDWQELEREIKAKVQNGQHVAYIEPDATVNHLDSAIALARRLPCVSTFRNLAPDESGIQVIGLGN